MGSALLGLAGLGLAGLGLAGLGLAGLGLAGLGLAGLLALSAPGTAHAAPPAPGGRSPAVAERSMPRRPPRALAEHLERRAQATLLQRELLTGLFPQALRFGEEQAGAPGPTPPAPPGPPPLGQNAGLHFEHIHLQVDLDPVVGTVDATCEVTVTGHLPATPSFYALVDQGLAFTGGSAPGYVVELDESPYPPFNYGSVTLSPQVPAGERVTITLRYSGVLECASHGARGSRYCSLGGALNHFQDGGAFPMIFDGRDPYGLMVIRHTLTLRLPAGAGSDAMASADLVHLSEEGGKIITEWQAEPITSRNTFMVITGDLTGLPVPGTSPPFTVVHVTGQPDWAEEMVAWEERIVPFLDDQAGAPFPYASVGVVKLPAIDGFPGTASYGMVYLAEYYAEPGPEYFEEILAHETCHLWWGVIVYPTDNSLWLVEGLAILSQYDHTYLTHYAHLEPREEYLAQRYHWNTLQLRYLTDPATLPPLVLQPAASMPDTLPEQVVWAYMKSSATLDHLRATIGDAVFAEGLRAYRQTCQWEDCTTEDFQAALQDAAPPGDPVASDLTSFMDNWVFASRYVRLRLDFVQAPESPDEPDGPQEVTVSLAQSNLAHEPTSLQVTVQLWLELADGTREVRRVTMSQPQESFTLRAGGPVVALRPNPRHDSILWSRPRQEGDANFDRAVDGLDLVACAMQEGRRATSGQHIYDVDLAFDPRCDFNDDGVVDEADLLVIEQHFGQVVQP